MKRQAGMAWQPAWARQAVGKSISVLMQAYMLQTAPCCMVEVATMQPEEACAEAYHRLTQCWPTAASFTHQHLPGCLLALLPHPGQPACRCADHAFCAHCPSQKPPETVSLTHERELSMTERSIKTPLQRGS